MSLPKCKCGRMVGTILETEPLYVADVFGGYVMSRHTHEVCTVGIGAAKAAVDELAALRTSTRLRRPTPEQRKLEPSGVRALVGIVRVPYEAFRSMLIDLSPTLSYLVEGVAFEGSQLRVKMRSVEIATYRCDACVSGLFEAVVPQCDETNQDVSCPYCHSQETTAGGKAGLTEDEKAATLHFGVALAEVQRLAGCDGATVEAARALGITLAGFKVAGGMDFDLRALRKAGVR